LTFKLTGQILLAIFITAHASSAAETLIGRLNSEASALFTSGKFEQAAKLWEKAAITPVAPDEVGPVIEDAVLGAARAYRWQGKEYFRLARARLMELGAFESNWEANLLLADIYWEEGNFITAINYYDKASALNSDADSITIVRRKIRNQAFTGKPGKNVIRELWIEPKPDHDPCRSKKVERHASFVDNGRKRMLCAELKDGSDDKIRLEIVIMNEQGQQLKSAEIQDFPLRIWEAQGRKRRLLLETSGHAVRFVNRRQTAHPDLEVTWNSTRPRQFFPGNGRSSSRHKTIYIWRESGYVDRELEKSRELDQKAAALFAADERSAAIQLWQQGLGVARSPTTGITANGTLLYNLGAAWLARGDKETARTFLEQAIAADPLNAEAYLRLGDYYAAAALRTERLQAVPCYEKMLLLEPEHVGAEQIRRKISAIENIDGGKRSSGIYVFEINPSRPLYTFSTSVVQDRLDSVAVSREGVAEPLQVLELSDRKVRCQPRAHPAMLVMDDFNFDGYQDLAVSCARDAAGNEEMVIWLFIPESNSFVFSKTLSALPNPVPLAMKKRIFSRFDSGDGGRTFREGEYAWNGGDLVLVREEQRQRTADGRQLQQTVRELKDGVMAPVGTETMENY
jgi:tetratricopeptide (TPR) repeat protein